MGESDYCRTYPPDRGPATFVVSVLPVVVVVGVGVVVIVAVVVS